MKLLIAFGLAAYVDAGWYGRSIHVSDRGEWNFDLKKKPINKVRLFGQYFGAVAAAQQELTENPGETECPILLLCSDRSIKPGKTWNDEYAESKFFLRHQMTNVFYYYHRRHSTQCDTNATNWYASWQSSDNS